MTRDSALYWRQRATRLAYVAETLPDNEPCRNVAYEQNELRRASCDADQRARIVETHMQRAYCSCRTPTLCTPSMGGRGGHGGAWAQTQTGAED
jgi:hypothetical protein